MMSPSKGMIRAAVATTPRGLQRTRRPFDKLESRDRDIERIVKEALKERRTHLELIGEINAGAHVGVVRELPRRRFSKTKPGPPPDTRIFKEELHPTSVFATLARCLVWVKVIWAFQLGVLWDKILRRDSVDRRAVRFVKIFQDAGGSFSKIGQQLAMRVDLLPYEYCRELSKLLDTVPPFPTEQAIKAIERSTGKPLDETFAAFDPKPIGSASIACVYQAVLKNGDKVAVKVRRPSIGKIFANDLKAMSWMISLMEAFAIIRTGYLDNFIQEFSATLFEELDFRMEAYHQSIFQRQARKNNISKTKFFSAPNSHYHLSNNEVLVQEFVSGIWMWEILAAVESNDKDALSRMQQLNIDPDLVARRLYWVQYWGQLLSPLFHADPHPANILVQRDSKLVFIDFGACGALSHGKQKLTLEMMGMQAKKDISGVVRCLLAFMEPMPPVDMHKLIKELEMSCGTAMHRIWSKHAPWYEKTSASLTFKLFEVTQKYKIPVNLDTVRSFRANMLYDTLAMRISPTLDPLRGIKDFLKDYEKSIQKNAKQGLLRRLDKGLLSGAEIGMMQDVAEMGARGVSMMRRLLDRPQFSFNYMIEKSVFAIMESVRLITKLSGVTFVACVIAALVQREHGLPFEARAVAAMVFTNKVYYGIVGVLALISTRRIMMRLADQDI